MNFYWKDLKGTKNVLDIIPSYKLWSNPLNELFLSSLSFQSIYLSSLSFQSIYLSIKPFFPNLSTHSIFNPINLFQRMHRSKDGLSWPCRNDPEASSRPSRRCPGHPRCRSRQSLEIYYKNVMQVFALKHGIDIFKCCKNVNVPFMFAKKISKSGTRKSKILLRWCQSVKRFPSSFCSEIKHVDGMLEVMWVRLFIFKVGSVVTPLNVLIR